MIRALASRAWTTFGHEASTDSAAVHLGRYPPRSGLVMLTLSSSGFGPGRVKTQSMLWFPLLNRGGMMKGFVQGADRQQTTLLPECLDDWVGEAILFARSMCSSMRWSSAISGSMASVRQRPA